MVAVHILRLYTVDYPLLTFRCTFPSTFCPYSQSPIPHPSSLIIQHSSFTPGWPILSLEIPFRTCYARRSVLLVFFGNQNHEKQGLKALHKRGKIAILTPKEMRTPPADTWKNRLAEISVNKCFPLRVCHGLCPCFSVFVRKKVKSKTAEVEK
jgi:hypothetical protein